MLLSNNSLASTAMRFGFAGAANTLLTLAAYQIALYYTSPATSYVISWLIGLAFVAVFYPSRVFSAKRSFATSLAVTLVYLVSFLAGLAVVQIASAYGHERAAVVLAMVLTLTSNFLGARVVLRWLSLRGEPN